LLQDRGQRITYVISAFTAMLLRCALFWDTTQHRVVIVYRRFGTTYRSYLQRSRSPRQVLKVVPICCPETSVKDYHSTLPNIPEECRCHSYSLLRDRHHCLVFCVTFGPRTKMQYDKIPTAYAVGGITSIVVLPLRTALDSCVYIRCLLYRRQTEHSGFTPLCMLSYTTHVT
jgi:hypothetical protein